MRTNNPKWIINHHEAGNNGFDSVNRCHRQNPNVWLGEYSSLGFAIAYHYYIDKLGKIHQGRLDTEEGAHTKGMNISSIGICLQGNFSKVMEYPTEAQRIALKGLLMELMKKHNIPVERITPHRKWANTECFGTNLPDDFAQKLVIPELLKSDNKKELVLLKEQIKIIKKLIEVYIKLLGWIRRDKRDA